MSHDKQKMDYSFLIIFITLSSVSAADSSADIIGNNKTKKRYMLAKRPKRFM